jgi:acyl carrier protein
MMELNIKLNGSNYVSDKTKHAFEEALQDGHRVKATAERAPDPAREEEAPPPPPQARDDAQQPPPRVEVQPQIQHLERGIDRSYEHQQEILRVHEQYLQGQAAYANVFSQLMDHQRSLLDQEDGTPEHTQALLAVLEHLSKSLSQFHEHQGETLKVHDRFLSHQSTYAEAQVRLLQKQIELAVNTPMPRRVKAAPAPPPRDSASETVTGPATASVRSAPPVSDAAREKPAAKPQRAPDEKAASQPQSTTGPSTTSSVDPAVLESSLLECVSDATGYPPEMLELDMDMEADLGIDSIKRVEILGALQDAHPTLPAFEAEDLAELRSLGEIIDYARDRSNGHHDEPSAIAASSGTAVSEAASPDVVEAESGALPDMETLTPVLLEIVSDATGYPAEMLELDMDMEADLGIDSIKRVEILGALQDRYPDLPQFEAEALGELRTLAEILNAVDASSSSTGPEDDQENSKKV